MTRRRKPAIKIPRGWGRDKKKKKRKKEERRKEWKKNLSREKWHKGHRICLLLLLLLPPPLLVLFREDLSWNAERQVRRFSQFLARPVEWLAKRGKYFPSANKFQTQRSDALHNLVVALKSFLSSSRLDEHSFPPPVAILSRVFQRDRV